MTAQRDWQDPHRPPDEPVEESVPGKDDRNMAMLCHLLGFLGLLGPIIVWAVTKDRSPYIDYHGRESVNFQISLMIYSLVLTATIVGILLVPVLVVFAWVYMIIGSMRANEGQPFEYPLTIRFV